MHPPFYTPDTRVSYDIRPHGGQLPRKRRGERPVRLTLLPAPGWPPIRPALAPPDPQGDPVLPSGETVPMRPVLTIVPPPNRRLRHRLGRLLIRLGQRMILENQPG